MTWGFVMPLVSEVVNPKRFCVLENLYHVTSKIYFNELLIAP